MTIETMRKGRGNLMRDLGGLCGGDVDADVRERGEEELHVLTDPLRKECAQMMTKI